MTDINDNLEGNEISGCCGGACSCDVQLPYEPDENPSFETQEIGAISFTKKRVWNACLLFDDGNPIHLHSSSDNLVVPGAYIEGRVQGLLLRWAKEHNGLAKALLTKKTVLFFKRIRVDREYKCVVQYIPDQADWAKIFVVDAETNDVNFPCCVIEFQFATKKQK